MSPETRDLIRQINVRFRPRAPARTGVRPALGDRLQYCSRSALQPGDSVEVAWHCKWRRSRVEAVHRSSQPLPARYGDYADNFVAGYMYTYDLVHEDPHKWSLEGALDGGVKLAAFRCRNVERSTHRRSTRLVQPVAANEATATRDGRSNEPLPPTAKDVGRRLTVFWPEDDKWYRGTLVSIKPTDHKQHARTTLPIASTGERTGNCFLAAVLAHVLELDLQTQRVPEASSARTHSSRRSSTHVGGC